MVRTLASRIAGYAGVSNDGVDGWLVPPRDPVALALALVRALADERGRAALAAAGRRKAQLFNWLGIARRVLSVYGRGAGYHCPRTPEGAVSQAQGATGLRAHHPESVVHAG